MLKNTKNKMKYYPVVRYRSTLTQEYIEKKVSNGLVGYITFEEAYSDLCEFNTDDCDYEVVFYDGVEWKATRDGKTIVCRRIGKYG